MSGSRETAISFQNRRPLLNSLALFRTIVIATLACTLAGPLFAQRTGPTSITLEDAIQMALQHNHNMLAARTTIQQSEAEETTANLRPNPTLFADWEYLPLTHSAQNSQYLHDSTEADIGVSYL